MKLGTVLEHGKKGANSPKSRISLRNGRMGGTEFSWKQHECMLLCTYSSNHIPNLHFTIG